MHIDTVNNEFFQESEGAYPILQKLLEASLELGLFSIREIDELEQRGKIADIVANCGNSAVWTLKYPLLQALPDNKYFWKYGFAQRHGFKEPLDRMVNLFLNTDGKETMEKVVRLLKPISDEYESAYGNPRNAPTYYENQLYGKNGLYAQIGNQILHEVRTFAKSQQMQKAVGNMTAEEFDALQKEQAVLPIDLGSSTEQDFISPEMEDVFHLLNEIPPPVEEDEIEQPFIEKSPEVKSDSIPTERSNQLAEAFELMKQHFDKRDESLDQRQMGIQYKLNQENADREDTIERRAMYIHAVDSETDFVHYEPTSIQKHKTLDEEFVSAKEQKSSESEEGNEQHNLDRFSKKNRTMILSQNPGATFVYGPQQWKLNGRKVREDEIDQPLIIIAPYKIEDTVVFEEICVYDISQTEAYQPTAAELEELLKKETAKGKSVAPRNVSRFQDRRKEMEMRKMVQSLRRSCENSLQHYLNERAYRELQYESQSNI
ncbi:relaxase MobL [Enterococcus innesii]|uniref:relaxase MobL n=1 Tax=Enterococcus innesii TaxID=2839759 RepID=UPI0032E46055